MTQLIGLDRLMVELSRALGASAENDPTVTVEVERQSLIDGINHFEDREELYEDGERMRVLNRALMRNPFTEESAHFLDALRELLVKDLEHWGEEAEIATYHLVSMLDRHRQNEEEDAG